jgi:peptide/nickel transport system substrate-binding protein
VQRRDAAHRHAVAKSFDRALGISDAKTKGPTVLGEFGTGPFTVSADDAAGTFTLTLGSPFSEALTGFAMGSDGLVICPKGLGAGALDDAAYGTGPYTIASQDRPNSITLKLRPEWKWGPSGRTAEGLPGTIVYKNIPNDTTAANLLLTGGLDIARVQGIDVQRLQANESLGKLIRTPFYTNPMWMNTSPGHATADPKVREALTTAVSAEGWNQAAFGGLGTITTSLFAKNAPCFEPATEQYVPATDLAEAKQVLLSAGYTADSSGKLSKDGQLLRIQVVGETAQGSGPEYIQTQFTQLGITVDFVNTDHVNYSSNYLQPGKWDVIVPGIATNVLGQNVQSYIGPDLPVGRNYSRLHDAAIEDQVMKALRETGDQACADWKAIQIAWLKNFYFRPLSAQNFYWFSRSPKWSFNGNTSAIQPNSFN